MLQLAVRGYGEARQQTARFRELILAWDAAGRPGTDRLRIDACPSGGVPPDSGAVPHPDSGGVVSPDTGGIVHVTPYATYVIPSSGA